MLIDFNLPQSTEIGRFVAKNRFYKQASITPKIQLAIEQQIERITWMNKISPTILNVSSRDIVEFQVFRIELRSTELDNAVLSFIQKIVPYPILFCIKGTRGVCVSAVIKSDSKPVILTTGWKSDITLLLRGNSTESIYNNYLYQISPYFAKVGGDIKKYITAVRLQKKINTLSTKIKREVQINKRQELARERYDVQVELERLTK